MPGHLTLMYNVKSLFISRHILQKASELVFCCAQSLSLYRVLLFMLSGTGPSSPRSDGWNNVYKLFNVYLRLLGLRYIQREEDFQKPGLAHPSFRVKSSRYIRVKRTVQFKPAFTSWKQHKGVRRDEASDLPLDLCANVERRIIQYV